MNGDFNYNTCKVDFEFFVHFIGPVISIVAIMAAVILVHPESSLTRPSPQVEWVKKPKLAHADRPPVVTQK